MNIISTRWFPIVLVLLGSASYGLLSPFIKMAYAEGYNDIQVSISQITMGTACLWFMMLIRPRMWSNPFRGPWIRLSLVGLFGLVLTTFFYNSALNVMDASLAIVLLFQFTWMTLLLDVVINRRKPTRYQIVAVILVLCGTVLAVGLKGLDLSSMSMMGVVWGLLSGLTYSGFIFFTGKIETDMHPVLKSAVMLSAALPILYVLHPPQHVFEMNPEKLVLWGILLGVLGQVIPTTTFNYGIPRIGSSLAAILGSMELPVAIISAYLILGEHVAWLQWAGIILILVGIMVSEVRGNVGE